MIRMRQIESKREPMKRTERGEKRVGDIGGNGKEMESRVKKNDIRCSPLYCTMRLLAKFLCFLIRCERMFFGINIL